MDDLDGSLGCVLTNLETGLPLADEYRAGTVMNENMIMLVSHVGIDLFRGKLVRNFERSLSRSHGSSDGFVREVQLTTSNTYQFMSAVPGWDHVIFILVTNKRVSLGMGLLAVHDAVRRLGEVSTRTAAPAVNTTYRPREEPSAPSVTSVTSAVQRPEAPPGRAERDIAFDSTRQREVVRNERPELPQPQGVDNGSQPQSEPGRTVLARDSSTPESVGPEWPAPTASPGAPTAPPAEAPTSSVMETPEATTRVDDVPSPETRRHDRGVALNDPDTEESTPSPVPIGPRARMFFKRDEREKSRRRRS